MTRKNSLLMALREKLETLEVEIIDYPPWADEETFDELVKEARQIAEMIRILTEE
jgi:hypothetical protein